MKIAILGYGMEGQSALAWLKRKNPKYEIDVFDEKVEVEGVKKVKSFLDVDYRGYGVIVRSPTVLPDGIRGKIVADKNGGKDFNFTSLTNIFFAKCPCPIYGVTATKGKGTISTMVASILRASGKKIWLVGNIGVAALDVLDEIAAEDLVVYEIGVSQARDLKKSPQVAVIGTIAADHLDLFDGDFQKYVDAKKNVVKFQTAEDLAVFYDKNQYSQEIAEVSVGRKLAYPSEMGAHIRGGKFYFGETEICDADVLRLPGEHNKENALAAISATWGTVSARDIREGLAAVEGLPHRLEFVREVGGVKWYDDNFSSATPAAEVAVGAFREPVILIAGGFDRGVDYAEFVRFLNGQKNLKKVILMGQTAERMSRGLEKDSEIVSDLGEAVRKAREAAATGDVVVMSPGAPSFDMFKNFEERAAEYRKIVGGNRVKLILV